MILKKSEIWLASQAILILKSKTLYEEVQNEDGKKEMKIVQHGFEEVMAKISNRNILRIEDIAKILQTYAPQIADFAKELQEKHKDSKTTQEIDIEFSKVLNEEEVEIVDGTFKPIDIDGLPSDLNKDILLGLKPFISY